MTTRGHQKAILPHLIAGFHESAIRVEAVHGLDPGRTETRKIELVLCQDLPKAEVGVRAHRARIQRKETLGVGDALGVLKTTGIVGHNQSEGTDLMTTDGNLRATIGAIQEVAQDLGIDLTRNRVRGRATMSDYNT